MQCHFKGGEEGSCGTLDADLTKRTPSLSTGLDIVEKSIDRGSRKRYLKLQGIEKGENISEETKIKWEFKKKGNLDV